ncbi:hypothetical protein ARMGADRAFT_1047237 [Armillaria gallica]|uniref:CxC2-like cysteine cluster KDZ transposase-associated domain-containing protein n=1 Tax=Armillaria gallica TaxID=47427 RepID=A0A2H3D242_ARMGA|nr:hypothetical protein ARMGADRAFT_1047237 [Armillaria gallica]
MEEVEDDERIPWRQWYRHDFPQDRHAGMPYSQGQTNFERIHDEQVLKGYEILGPFKDDNEWELAKWLIHNVGHSAAEEFLKLPIPQFKTKQQLYDQIDELPQGKGIHWRCEEFDCEGDILDKRDSSGRKMKTEHLEMWYRDPIEIVRELLGNPIFKDVMAYAPIQLFTDAEGKEQVFNEMWTGEWWWKIQEQLPPGVTIALLIISSDKTQLSQFRGDKTAWPVYLTIGNISKDTRRELSSHATILLGYLPVPKFDCYTDKVRSVMKYHLFHRCMLTIMHSVAEAGNSRVSMVCADSLICLVYPIFAVYIADYPEQCLISCCKENRCPICKVDPDHCGSHQLFKKRDIAETLSYLHAKEDGQETNMTYGGGNVNDFFKAYGLQAVYPPFWSALPHSDIFVAFTPDLLHQLHKGVFKDHLVKWCTSIIGAVKVDEAFRTMPLHPGLCHFKNGILHVSQWTGTEHKEMEKVFLTLVAAHACDEVVMASHIHIFIELEARSQNHFNILKIHSMEHYEDLICLFGNGYNMEAPEHLHINYAKDAYRVTNHKNYIQQMTLWLQHQEAIDRFTKYLRWIRQNDKPSNEMLPAEPELEMSASSGCIYHIAKTHPPDLRNLSAEFIISAEGHNASQFLSALTTFLLRV